MVTPLVKPTTIVEPFANSGAKNTIPVTASATPGRASLDTGFPPLTMTPVASGGVPPSGLDFNGILNLITQHSSWANAGGQYTFDAALATFIGGYPIGMVLQANDGLASYVNVAANNATDFNTTPAAIGVSWMPYGGAAVASSGSTAIVTTGGTTTLSNLQAARRTISVTGALTSNATIVFPAQLGTWVVVNKTTGAFSLNCKTASVAGVVVAQGKADILVCDGTAIVYGQNDAETVTLGDATTRIANTAFVAAAIAAALINTPLTGNPTAPTQAPLSNSTRIATTAYADAAVVAATASVNAQYKNAAFTAGFTGDYWTDTTGGVFTMTLPDPPVGANLIRVQDITGNWGSLPLTIDPGTKTILGTAGTLLCDVSGEAFQMWYDATNSTWKLA